MRSVRKSIEIADGVKVDLLFTPRLYEFKGFNGVSFEVEGDASQNRILGVYADTFYCAALNAWELDGHGTPEEFPHTRGDFHAWMQGDPVAFRQTIDFCLRALTGKGLEEFAQKAAPTLPEEEVKKKTSRFLGLRSKHS